MPQNMGDRLSRTQLLISLRRLTAKREAPSGASIQTYAVHLPLWRKQLVAWISSVGRVFSLCDSTIAHAVLLFDRVLGRIKIVRDALQTVALACVCVASKLHESTPIGARHIRDYFHAICTVEAIRHTEMNLLSCLGWDMGNFTALDFVGTVMELLHADDATLIASVKERAHALHALSMLEYEFLGYSQSSLGLAIVACACQMHDIPTASLNELLRAHDITVTDEPLLTTRLLSAWQTQLAPPADTCRPRAFESSPLPSPASTSATPTAVSQGFARQQTAAAGTAASAPIPAPAAEAGGFAASAASAPGAPRAPSALASAAGALYAPPPPPPSLPQPPRQLQQQLPAPHPSSVLHHSSRFVPSDGAGGTRRALGPSGPWSQYPTDGPLGGAPERGQAFSPAVTEEDMAASQVPPSPATTTHDDEFGSGCTTFYSQASSSSATSAHGSFPSSSSSSALAGRHFRRAESNASAISLLQIGGGGGAGDYAPRVHSSHGRSSAPLPLLRGDGGDVVMGGGKPEEGASAGSKCSTHHPAAPPPGCPPTVAGRSALIQENHGVGMLID